MLNMKTCFNGITDKHVKSNASMLKMNLYSSETFFIVIIFFIIKSNESVKPVLSTESPVFQTNFNANITLFKEKLEKVSALESKKGPLKLGVFC